MLPGVQFVTVYKCDDPLHGETLAQLLRDGGVNARLLGTRNAALIGVAPHILSLRIEVPASDEERARELIDAFENAHPATPRDPAMRDDPETSKRSPVLAGGSAFILPGGSHFYSHRPWTALMLALGIVVAFVAMAAGHDQESTCAALAFAGLIGCDLIGGQRAVRAWNRGERVAAGRQLLTGITLVVATAVVAVAVGTHLPKPRLRGQVTAGGI
jgi:hypothetical protein